MSYSCKILLDSISETGKRLTTFEITFPRIILAELNTHRMFSRNSASSRAIPFEKQLDKIYKDPFIPEKFPKNTKGMQPQEYIEQGSVEYYLCAQRWLIARDDAICNASLLNSQNFVHKQIVNRLLEPFMWHTVILTATEFDNFFKLRCDENAQYEIRRIADLMYEAYHAFDPEKEWIEPCESHQSFNKEWTAIKPQKLKVGEWHCPLVSEEDDNLIYAYIQTTDTHERYVAEKFIEVKKKISVARAARVSYLTHYGIRSIEKDLELFERLRTSGHWSPFEHVATPYFDVNYNSRPRNSQSVLNRRTDADINGDMKSGNFLGWKQYRKEFQDENCTNFRKE